MSEELRVKEVKDRLEKLKWRNASLKDENMNLRERLEQADILMQANGANDRMKELEEELSKQILKVSSLESELKKVSTDPISSMKGSTARELSSPARPTPENDVTSCCSNVDVTDAAPSMEVLKSAAKEAATTNNTQARKVSAPSPSRRGLKLFGRK